MKLFILAAGIGSRLLPLTKNTPKSLLDLGDGTTLLERQIENAIASEVIKEVVIITGYKSEQIEAKVKSLREEIKISIVFNPFYDISNNLLSMWVVNYLLEEDDFIITNGDNIYKDTVYSAILSDALDATIQLTIDKKDSYDDDDMKVLLDENEKVIRVHKNIDKDAANAESVGLVCVKGLRQRMLMKNKIIELAKDISYRNKFWLEIFNSLIGDGTIIDTVSIDRNDWREMDFHPDVDLIRHAMVKNLF